MGKPECGGDGYMITITLAINIRMIQKIGKQD